MRLLCRRNWYCPQRAARASFESCVAPVRARPFYTNARRGLCRIAELHPLQRLAPTSSTELHARPTSRRSQITRGHGLHKSFTKCFTRASIDTFQELVHPRNQRLQVSVIHQ